MGILRVILHAVLEMDWRGRGQGRGLLRNADGRIAVVQGVKGRHCPLDVL